MEFHFFNLEVSFPESENHLGVPKLGSKMVQLNSSQIEACSSVWFLVKEGYQKEVICRERGTMAIFLTYGHELF